MAVSHDDVRHVAELARLAVAPDRLDPLVTELNGILGHMDVLSNVDTSAVELAEFAPTASSPTRADSSGPVPLRLPLAEFLVSIKDGFILVPRLASHEDAADRAP
jgi:aspartyl-tRNA(Asn)/glutamyl-tRNA(Gln) amidotransferase subunit C